ncbi:MAG: competence/damage-inducible protein A [Bacteroidetes bacterium]|nr:competence/damage-inducible protein A [Bacteroidota bacterium]
MISEIINIGDELLIGQVINTNASWLGEQLNLAGIRVEKMTVVADNHQAIMQSLKDAAAGNAEIILITGGLGPTRDDITKKVLCEFFDTRLVYHEDTMQNIVNLFAGRFLKIRESNRQQAEIPENCIPLPNYNGTAPGMWFEKDGKIFVSMPGVPFEMKPIVLEQVIPRLAERPGISVIIHKTILTQGMGESMIAEKIVSWEDRLPEHMKLAYLPQPGIVRLRISAAGDDKVILEKEVEEQVEKLKHFIPDIIFGYGQDTLESVTGNLLKEKGFTLSSAESCTGGYIAHLITSVPGSSAYFKGSIIAYSNEIKTSELGVPEDVLLNYGAVSQETVLIMASNIRKKLRTDFAIAVSGIAGPDGGTPSKPVGTTWIAVAGPAGETSRHFLMGENRERNIRKAALAALDMLRKEILKS